MSRFCFLHAADVRLDTPFEGMGRVTPEIAAVVRDATLKSWDALVQLAIDREAAFVLLAGNIYDGTKRGVRAQLHFLRGLERLDEHGIQTFVIFGEHDAPDEWSAVRRWPESVVIFGAETVTAHPVERNGERMATVYGKSYAGDGADENPVQHFRRGGEGGIHVGLFRCAVANATDEQPPEACSLEDLLNASMDYWALGHSRRRHILNETPCWVAYSGALQGLNPDDDSGPTGALVVEADNDTISQVAFEPLDSIRFVRCEVDAAAMDEIPALHKALTLKLAEVKAENQGRPLIVRAVLQGRGGMHATLKHPDCVAELLRDLREEAEDEGSPIWWEAIVDKTQPEINRDVVRRRNDFSAELLRQGDTLGKNPEALAAFVEEQCKTLSRLAVRKVLRDLEPAEVVELLREAEDLALDLLEGSEEP